MIRVAINGYGRIGRDIVRALFENGYDSEIEIVAINDLADPKLSAYLTRHDSTFGTFQETVELIDDTLIIKGQSIKMLSCPSVKELPWKALNIDIVFECTGHLKTREQAAQHLTQGAQRVLISAPASDADKVVVYGVNHNELKPEHRIISNASCTTNCLAPVIKAIIENCGLQQGSMTTIHAYTNDQSLIDRANDDPYRSRSAALSMIPTKTGAAAAVGIVIPEVKGKLDGMAVRVPTVDVSLIDLHFVPEKPVSADEINQFMKIACDASPKGIFAYNEEPLVSVDFIHNPASSIFDSTQTRTVGNQIKLMAWYDNEWGFANRMLDMALVLNKLSGYD